MKDERLVSKMGSKTIFLGALKCLIIDLSPEWSPTTSPLLFYDRSTPLISTNCGWEGKRRYGSFRLRMKRSMCR